MEKSNRARLIADVISRRHNVYRKDGKLEPQQVENLVSIYGLDVRTLNKMTEKEILASLRKRHKRYNFNLIKL